jgi:NADH-quinone oxidoreductase subunit M
MNMPLHLVLLLLIPLVGAAIGSAMNTAKAARNWALLVSLLTALVALIVATHFNWKSMPTNMVDALQFNVGPDSVHQTASSMTLKEVGFSFSLGVDSISLWLVLLTAFLMPLAVAASFASIQQRAKEYYAWMLLLLFSMIGVFLARDMLLFYVFFELTLVPMFFIIGIWGGPDRRRAAGRFFLFTFTGSVFALAAIIYLGVHPGWNATGPSFNIVDATHYAQHYLPAHPNIRLLIAIGLLIGFAVKVPLFPVHTWLPLAHTEAPTAGSVILAGVLLKLGTYGLLRLAIPMGFVTPTGTQFLWLLKFVGMLCVIGIIYGALVAWVQQDIKKLVAYSSVSHLGFCVLGLFALNVAGIQGSVLYMINHGLSTGAMFLIIGMIYDRYHTRDINQLGGLAKKMPVMSFFFVLFAMSSIGLPGLNGFSSEFLTILGAFTSRYLGIRFGALAAIGVILGAVYMLHMTARIIFGPLKTPGMDAHHNHGATASHGTTTDHAPSLPDDLNAREIAILAPIALAIVLLGVVPNSVLVSIFPSSKLITQVDPMPKASALVQADSSSAVAEAK